MTPDTILFSDIKLPVRGRKTYDRIDELAEDITNLGLIQPIVLDSSNTLVAGGRRYYALQLLEIETLHHGVTSHPAGYYCETHGHSIEPCCELGTYSPLKIGFLRKSDSFQLNNRLAEISENLNRQEISWKEQVPMIVEAWHIAKAKEDINSEKILMSQFGAMLGCGFSNLQSALYVHDDLKANPERYKDVNSIFGAYSVLLKVNAIALSKVAMEKSLTEVPKLTNTPTPLPENSSEISDKLPSPTAEITIGASTQKVSIVEAPIEHPLIPLSQSFINVNSLDFMEECAADSFDHIFTDPDYAIDKTLLSSGTGTQAGLMQSGVHQKSIEDSLEDLYRFLRLAYKVVKPFGFCFFFYDISHHEKLQNAARNAGWLVQDWPLTWRKLDYRSNAAPQYNTCKNVEWVMVCRKPDACLAKAQMSSVYDTMTKKVAKSLGHPFAKPFDLWKWLFAMVTIKGQVIFDPFAGSGSCPIAALQYGLRPVGCEISPDHFATLMCNLQIHYKQELGPNLRFS